MRARVYLECASWKGKKKKYVENARAGGLFLDVCILSHRADINGPRCGGSPWTDAQMLSTSLFLLSLG